MLYIILILLMIRTLIAFLLIITLSIAVVLQQHPPVYLERQQSRTALQHQIIIQMTTRILMISSVVKCGKRGHREKTKSV